MSQPLSERNAEIVALRSRGLRLEEIARKFGLTRERVRQIIAAEGGPSAAEAARARRIVDEGRRGEELESFVSTFSEAIESLAAGGATRSEVVDSIMLLCPELDMTVVNEGVDLVQVPFNKAITDTNYSESSIEAAVWFAAGLEHGVDGGVADALPYMDASAASELQDVLLGLGTSVSRISDIIKTVALARSQAAAGEVLSISKQRYDTCRTDFLAAEGLKSSKGTAYWPPSSQTVIKRFGRGYWSTALDSLGLRPKSGGRERGLLVFTEDEYVRAVSDYAAFAAAHRSAPTFFGYQEWVAAEDREGRRRPSGASIRNQFGSWTNAKRAAQRTRTSPTAGVRETPPVGPSLFARASLVASESTLEESITRLQSLDRASASAEARDFLRQFIEEFEIRRRDWLRAVVQADPTIIQPRLSAPAGRLTRAQRRVMPSVENLEEILTDRYLDGLLAEGDPTETDGWLRADLQDELDVIPQLDRLRFEVARAMRNLFTHHSEESKARLAKALSARVR